MDSQGLSELLATILMEQGQHAQAANIYRYACSGFETSPPACLRSSPALPASQHCSLLTFSTTDAHRCLTRQYRMPSGLQEPGAAES